MIKVTKTQVIPQPSEDDSAGTSSLLKRISLFNSQLSPNVLHTEILKLKDPRSELAEFYLAKAKQITGLLNKKAFRIVLKEDLNRDANVLGRRFVLTIKNKVTDKEMFKARFVVQGHLD